MKTIILDTLRSFNRNLFIILPVLACFALLPQAQGQCVDGCNSSLFNTFLGDDALINNTTGSGNTALGWRSLFSNTDASFSTAVGGGALVLNNGASNTAVGAAALLLNTSGTGNVAVGTDALVHNDTGFLNNAVGAFALFNNVDAFGNNAFGDSALLANITASSNTAIGDVALQSNDSSGSGLANNNTAVGAFALISNVDGSENTAVGRSAGFSVTTGSGNTFIGANAGVIPPLTGEYNNTILLGILGDDDANNPDGRAYIGNIRDVTTGNADAIPVLIDSDGQLGTASSSRRFKKDIKPMDQTSEAILALKPVTFHYKERDTKKAQETPQYGLIAEDVAAVNPDLIVRDKDGEIYSVRYDAVSVMLLNEFLKEHREVQEQKATIAEFKKEIANLTATVKEQAAQIQKVNAQLELNNSAARTVASDQ
jgi:endosialidase-like protein